MKNRCVLLIVFIAMVVVVCGAGRESIDVQYGDAVRKQFGVFFVKPSQKNYDIVIANDTDISVENDDKEVLHITSSKCIQSIDPFLHFPDDVKIEYFDGEHRLSALICSNEMIWQQDENVVLLLGNVEVTVYDKSGAEKRFNTDYIFFDINNHVMFNNSFLRIELGDTVIEGDNILIKQDMSYYRIKNPHAVIPEGSNLLKQ